ncbi:alcohol oxidase-like protein [Schizophyllum amplum]|uniref:Alcohol oxidase-like protein n=1 Tax=Schizophyllum amplum TaxID=97359 RepID=A0A550CZR4_9AGAR|nr:alcohol oxidase-like protein [Auriculariopsis ampla]
MASQTYDIVFAGGGTTACVAAGRLAAADPSLKILILEAGGQTKGLDAHILPYRYYSHLNLANGTISSTASVPSAAVGGRPAAVLSGRCVGGGSSVNGTMYARPSASDFDDWKNIYENAGWGSADLTPLFSKMETYQEQSDRTTHGCDGPLKISYGGHFDDVGKQFLDVAMAYDEERGQIDDLSDFHECNGYARWAKFIDKNTGTRSDVAHHYVYNNENRDLDIEPGRQVKRVLFKGSKAIGVEHVDVGATQVGGDQIVRTTYASRLVVLAAGAFGSPTILERSGVGNPELLSKLGVPVKVDLPGVGEDYQNHTALFPVSYASEQTDTQDGLIGGEPEELAKWLEMWHTEGKGLIAHNGIDAGIKMRPTEADLKVLGAPFEKKWQTYFKNAPDKAVMLIMTMAGLPTGDPASLPPRKYFVVGFILLYPSSRGSVHAGSAEDANAPHNFDAGFLTDEHGADLATMKWGYKKCREFARRMPLFRGEYLPMTPKFARGSDAEIKEAVEGPVAIDAPDIIYDAEDDRELEVFIKENVPSVWHSLGTCAMKPRVRGGVVDAALNVYGTECLKVADLSIAPANVRANTCSTAVVIGEKAAIIIGKELGLKLTL